MTDTTPGGFADTPGPHATPEQDADVRALLGALRDADVPMPDDVWTRLAAVIAEEQRTATAAGAPAATTTSDDDAVVPGMAPVTVLPTAAERAARTSRPALRWVLGAAAAVIVVGGGYSVMHGLTGSSNMATSAGAASSAPETASGAGTVATASGTAYTTAGLQSQARALVASTVGGTPSSGQKDMATPVPSASAQVPAAASVPPPKATPSGTAHVSRNSLTNYSARLAALMPQGAALTRCIDDLSGTPGATAVAIDVGTFDGKPTLVVVLPSTDDPASLDVLFLPVDCTSSDFLKLVRVPRP